MMDAKTIIGLDERLRGTRGTLEQRWQEVSELIAPHEADFTITRSQGQLRGLQQYESGPAVAAENLAGGLWSLLTNPATQWFSLTPSDPFLQDDADVQAWLETVRSLMMRELVADGGSFYARKLECDRSVVRYGTGLLYTDRRPAGRGLRFFSPPVRECVVQEDDEGTIDFVSRRWKWRARQAVARWGSRTPEKIAKAAADRSDAEFAFLHVVMPNRERDPSRADKRGMPFYSAYVCVESGEVIEDGGLKRNPWCVARWARMQGSPYGYSPAMVALADTKTLNVMAKTFLVSSQKAADPPILAPDENAMMPFRIKPGGIIYGAVNAQGQRLVQPLEMGGAFTLTDAMMQAKREAVRNAFLGAALEMPDRPNRTATEVLQREEDRMRQMAPNLVRMQSEVLDPVITAVFEEMMEAGMFPPPPEALNGAMVQVEYVSPLARAQRASEGQAILRAFESIAPIAQVQPDVLDNFDLDAAARRVGDVFGLPGDLKRDPRKVLAQREARIAAQQQQQQDEEAAGLVGAVPGLARAARDAEQAPGVMSALGLDIGQGAA